MITASSLWAWLLPIVFVLQQWHAMQLETVRDSVVPRAEYEKHQEKVMDKTDILKALQMINARMNAMENNNAN